MDPITTIGQLLKGHHHRDAIHIAILPVIAGQDLRGGQPVALAFGTTNIVIAAHDEYEQPRSIGIIDPFLSDWRVPKGSQCWMFLHPNTVSGMRHHWSHPVIDTPVAAMSESEQWLHRFAELWAFDYDDMIATAINPSDDKDYIIAHGVDIHNASELGADEALFWQHLGVVTGRTFDRDHQTRVIWSCSC